MVPAPVPPGVLSLAGGCAPALNSAGTLASCHPALVGPSLASRYITGLPGAPLTEAPGNLGSGI